MKSSSSKLNTDQLDIRLCRQEDLDLLNAHIFTEEIFDRFHVDRFANQYDIEKSPSLLRAFVVWPESIRSQGIGTRLLEDVERRAKDNGYETVALEVTLDNVRAQELYCRLGYRKQEQGTVFGEWTERQRDGTILVHRDECFYMTKHLS
jgi:predicted N-acetyltransferase YhbS